MRFAKPQPALDLGGAWSFAYTCASDAPTCRTIADVEAAELAIYPCTVPGNFELDLHAAGVLDEPFYGMNMTQLRPLEHAHVYYFSRFTVPAGAVGEPQLVFEGLDCFADVYLNGHLVGICDNMLIEQVVPVEDALQEQNELLVHIRPAFDEAKQYSYPPAIHAHTVGYESVYVRKAPHMYGWDIMPRALSAGIWRPVQLRYLPTERIDYLFLDTLNVDTRTKRAQLVLHFQAQIELAAEDSYALELHATSDEGAFAQSWPVLFQAGSNRFSVEEAALWWPRGRGKPTLYTCEVRLLRNGREIDRATFSHGIRTVALERTSITDTAGSGAFCFWVNGERVFIHGSNWVPVDAFHSRDAARIPQIIEMAKDLNINMFRCWGGNVYEDDLFYELCDANGIMVWQDFAMACALYPQDVEFAQRLEEEARLVVRRLRQHPSLVLWAGDNECDSAYSWNGRKLDPNNNVLTRQVLPGVLRDEDPSRPYLPSSPYVDPVAFEKGEALIPEQHLWGPRDYFKSDFYKNSIAHFASEMGYHGCPAPASIRRFISPEKVWPYQDNEEWKLHSTSPVPGLDLFGGRVELMAKQIRELFGAVPDTLEEFALASQISQAEAKKFFIELFRSQAWRRTGLLWWNLQDGWPQFSDAIVDYYFCRKLAYSYIKRSQAPLCLMMTEPADWAQSLVVSNETRQAVPLRYTVTDVGTGAVVVEGQDVALADGVTPLTKIPFSMGAKRFYLIRWESELGEGLNHYLAGNPPFDLQQYRDWLQQTGLLATEWLQESGLEQGS